MQENEDEEKLLHSVALQTAQSILLARQRAEQELLEAKKALELRTQELAHSLAMMSATLESTTDGILVTDEHGTVTGFNRRFVEMWHMPEEVMQSRQHRQLIRVAGAQLENPEPFRQRIEEIYSSSPIESFDRLELSDGRVFERSSQIQSVEGRNVGRVWSFRDITERTRGEAERERLLTSEREARARAELETRMKDEFLATLSHELRTPLNAILGWASIVRTSDRSEDIAQGLEIIERNARAQTQLIEDLLDMSRIISGKVRIEVQRVELEPIIEAAIAAVNPMAAAKEITISTNLGSAVGTISGDPTRLQQVLWNLLTNALKFTPKGGHVEVILERTGSQLQLSVRDSGQGIPAEFLPHVFDRFRQADASTTREHRGLGLGLAIVKNLIELHGGSVRAKSPGMDQGSTFTVALPIPATKAEPEGGPRAALDGNTLHKLHDLAGVRVLAVDDEADARELIARLLADCGATVETAASAEEALQSLKAIKPHVLITDIGMPGEDGYGIIRKVRQLGVDEGGKVPAIALTAFARSEDRQRAILSGFQMHIAKPVEPSELVAMVASLAHRTSG